MLFANIPKRNKRFWTPGNISQHLLKQKWCQQILENIDQYCLMGKNDIYEHHLSGGRGGEFSVGQQYVLMLAILRVLPGMW